MVPLVAHRLVCDIITLRHGVANVLTESRNVIRKLYSNTCGELACMTDVSTASQEEEASPEPLFCKVFASDCTGNRRLSRAGQAVQPEDARRILPISPYLYFLKKIDAGVLKAGRFVLSMVRIEGRVDCALLALSVRRRAATINAERAKIAE